MEGVLTATGKIIGITGTQIATKKIIVDDADSLETAILNFQKDLLSGTHEQKKGEKQKPWHEVACISGIMLATS